MTFVKTMTPVCLALGLVAAAAAPAAAQTQPRLPIAFISIQRIAVEAADARVAAGELDALRRAKAEELSARKKDLDATKLELANTGGFFSATKRAQLQEQVRVKEAELQQATQGAQTEFQERQRQLQETLRQEINAIVSVIAAQRGFQYVLNQDAAMVLAPKGADLTAEVLEQLNAASAKRAADKK